MRAAAIYGFAPLLAAALFTLLATGTPAFSQGQVDVSRLDASALKKMMEGLGCELKALNEEAGKEKWEFSNEKGGLTIPIAVELSASGNYIWMTVFLGSDMTDEKLREKGPGLLRGNFKVQPSQFYVTEKGNLMLGMAVDNRGVTSTWMRRCIDKVLADVADNQGLWG